MTKTLLQRIRTTPLAILRSERDRAVDALRTDLRGDWLSSFRDLDECLTDLTQQQDLRCMAALEEIASMDMTGRSLVALQAAKNLSQAVGMKELEEYSLTMKRRTA